MMRRLSTPIAALATALALGGCGAVDLPSALPAPPTIQAVGILADERIDDPDRTYILVDGRTFHIKTDATRVLFEGGLGHPFVLGSDASGPFVAVFAHQEGLPDDCHIVPAGGDGIERGAFVEIKGVLWKKAADFHSDVAPPAAGEEWPATRFCFNEQAEVASAVP